MSGMLVLAEARSGEQAYMIAGITKNSPAADAGVQAGDQLIAINGTKVIDMSLDLVRNVLKSGTGTKVVVTIDRSGKRTMVTLALRRAI
jgi:C-terminal processing protease CtpA/Prc